MARRTGHGWPPSCPPDPVGVGVLLGAWTPDQTWRIHRDGHLETPTSGGRPGPRLCVLEERAVADLLLLSTHAHGHQLAPTGDNGPATLAHPTGVVTLQPAALPVAVTGDRAVRLTVLGGLLLTCRGEPVVVRRSAARQVVAFLAVHAGGATAVALAEAVWPGLPARTVLQRLYTTISEFGKNLQQVADGPVIRRDGDIYRLDPARVGVDLWEFRQAAIAATGLDPGQRRAAWHTLLAGYGELATGHAWPWLAGPRHAAPAGAGRLHRPDRRQ
jgi:hypothetical protein